MNFGNGKTRIIDRRRAFFVTSVTASAAPQLNQADSTKRSERNAPGNAGAKSSWAIIESTSPPDNSPQFSAGMAVGDAALILRCREQKTEAAFSTRDTYLGDKPVTMRFRINSEDPIKEIWHPSV